MRYASTITNKSHDKDDPNEIHPHLNINIDKKIMYTTTQNTEQRKKNIISKINIYSYLEISS